MDRNGVGARDAFPKSADAYMNMLQQPLQQRRAEMDAAWDELEGGWKDLDNRMALVGVRSRTSKEDILRLNIGGTSVNVSCSHLAEVPGFRQSILGGFFEGVWSKQVPRDADGRMVLDESPTCLKHIIHTMLNKGATSVAIEASGGVWSSAVPVDEVPYLAYISYILGLSNNDNDIFPSLSLLSNAIPPVLKHIMMPGGSTILGPLELVSTSAAFQSWFSRDFGKMDLIYRASRDGFDDELSKAGCIYACPTVTLVRVKGGSGANDDDSVVGGFSDTPWKVVPLNGYSASPHAFVFMLKDGSFTGRDPFNPVKWTTRTSYMHAAVSAWPGVGPCFGGSDLRTNFNGNVGCSIQTGLVCYDVDKDSPFLRLSGQTVEDIEVYSVCTPHPRQTSTTTTTHKNSNRLESCCSALSNTEAGDIRSFGEQIASSLMEERVVIDHAMKAMARAGAVVSSASLAREIVYGPGAALNNKDSVVELSVRGVRMTTLRSTLQVCPESALAARFDEEKWPATDQDTDEHGRRLIDCSPSCFSKVLDVLRMRKRALWTRSPAEKQRGGGGQIARVVVVKEADRACFDAFVNMYFPGCERFITDLVVV